MYRGRFIPASDGSLPAAVQPTELTADEADARRAGGRRIACVLIADFPIAALVRTNPEWRERPLALTRQARPRPARGGTAATSSKEPAGQWTPYGELSHVAPVAAAMGVRAGMTIAQGRALLPELIVTHPSPAAEEAARAALIDVAWSFSPVIEERAPGCVWIDLSGTEGLYRQEPYAAATALEQRIAEAIARRVRGIGLEAAVGIASSKELAYLAARCGGLRLVANGREREFLDWMPLELTELGTASGGLPDWLKRMGLRRLGDLARLDPHAVGTRMGAAGVALARLARGEGSALVRARPRPEDFTEALELEYGIEQLEALTFLLRAMLDRLCARLALRGLAVGGLTLGLGLADGGRDERRITAAAPTTESAALLTLLRLNLEARGPAAAVETLRLTAEARQPRPLVNDLFQPPAPAADRLGVVIARIAALCGPDRVGTLLAADSYRPEAVRVGAFAPSAAGAAPPQSTLAGKTPAGKPDVAPIALRAVRPAEEVEVLCLGERPQFVRGKRVCARVISSAGPWRRQGEWWSAATGEEQAGPVARPAAYARDYYELALADGGVYRVYYDHQRGQWFVDGVYD